MEQNSREKEIANLVSKVIGDYDGGKNIDATDIFNKPDRNEIIDIVNNLFFVMYPGAFENSLPFTRCFHCSPVKK